MKGLTHFMTGVCVATFFPWVVAAAYDPDLIMLTLLIPLGGLFGYLPDFLDFKFTRYTERSDFVTNPGYQELGIEDIEGTHLLKGRQAVLIIPKVVVGQGILAHRLAGFPGPNQPFRLRVWERPQDCSVDGAEHEGDGTDSDPQDKDG